LGGSLTVIYTAQSSEPQPKSRGALLPLLVVLFVVSYGILTLLVVEQGKTIEAQRSLLREMLKDSAQLASLKGKIAREVAAPQHDKPAAQTEQKEVAPNAPSAAPKPSGKESRRPGKSARIKKEAPERPAADLQDVRRSTRVI
jgi:hypothetical protein